jgi:hypothetical protein
MEVPAWNICACAEAIYPLDKRFVVNVNCPLMLFWYGDVKVSYHVVEE